MSPGAFITSAAELARTGDFWPHPSAVLELAAAPTEEESLRLPCCPVIGVGNRDHPLAGQVDVWGDSLAHAESLAHAAARQPLAASVVTQLLRILPALPAENGLTAESLAYATLQASAPHKAWIAALAKPAPSPEGRVELLRDGDVLSVVLDRAHAGNAIDRAMRDALHEAFELANLDETITNVQLRANGKAFSLGADIAEFGTTTDPAVAHMIRCRTLPAREAARCADRLEVLIDGACVGAGLELAAFARRVIATPRSWFQLPELAMGILPGAGGCVSLVHRIGRQRTLQMILSGRRIGARQALEWGLIDALVDELP